MCNFYGADERLLIQYLSLYVGTGLQRGDTLLAVVTADRRAALLLPLAALRADVAGAFAREQLVLLDETLRQLMVDGQPDPGAFEQVIGSTVRS